MGISMRTSQDLSVILAFCLFLSSSFAAENPSFIREQDHVIADVAGIGLPMDVYRPTSASNGLGIVFIVSAGWNSSRAILDAFSRSYSIFAKNGYTVFAVRPGSKTHFDVLQMAHNASIAIKYISENASQFGIDSDRIGLSGWSAGGHLASLVAVSSEFSEGSVANSPIAAVGVFFPATSFLDWGADGQFYEDFGSLHGSNLSESEIRNLARNTSPVYQIDPSSPPFQIWHGNADEVVPLQQSELFAQKLQEAGIEVELKIKSGGRHSWDGIAAEIEQMSRWFDSYLQ